MERINLRRLSVTAAAALFAVATVSGCAALRGPRTTPDGKPVAQTAYERVLFRSLEFEPKVPSDLKGYRKKGVVMASCTNDAGNTSNYSFDSVWGDFYYGNDDELLADTFCHAYMKVFSELEMPLYDYGYGGNPWAWGWRGYRNQGPPPHGTPTLDLVLTSVTDQEFAFYFKGYINDIPAFDKAFTVKGDPPTAAQLADADKMAARAYGMLNDAVVTTMRDPGFRKLFGLK